MCWYERKCRDASGGVLSAAFRLVWRHGKALLAGRATAADLVVSLLLAADQTGAAIQGGTTRERLTWR
jgi:hypothetical protein